MERFLERRKEGTVAETGNNIRRNSVDVGNTAWVVGEKRSRTTAARDTTSGNLIKVVAGTAYTC